MTLPPNVCNYTMCFISIYNCIIEGLILHIIEYFVYELLFDDLRE
jgi:hypothetical protein